MAPAGVMRLISYSQEIINGQPIHVSSNCLPVKASNLEPAGHAFHSAALKFAGFTEEEDTEDDKSDTPTEKEQAYTQSSDSYSSKGKKKSASGEKQQDHYALLGLAHLRYLATEDQIRKSYRETALRYHPDKQAALLLAEVTEAAKQAKKDEIESHFKAIQEAYEVLNDPIRRRVYDSTDEFDDEIPTDCAPQDFFKVFGPAFLRNGRWSVSQPIPSLGDENTSIKEVDNFYNFWYSFKSWREFPHADEFDIEQAESRDHKRWMERQNAKLSEKARKDEYARVRTLVDNAYKRDPRIVRRKEAEKAEKQRKKDAKLLAKKLLEEEAARNAAEEKRLKEEEDKKAAEAVLQQKKVREKEKKLLRKERTRLRTLMAPVSSVRLLEVTEEDVERLCMSLDMDQMRNLCDEIEGKENHERAKILKNALGHSLDHNIKDVREDESNSRQNGSSDINGQIQSSTFEKKEKPWKKEEIELLKKAMLKYPKGASRRWEVISEYIGTGRSVEEILKATKTVLLQKPDSAKAFDSFLEKRKAAPSIASPLSTREQVEGAASAATSNSRCNMAEPNVAANAKIENSDDSPRPSQAAAASSTCSESSENGVTSSSGVGVVVVDQQQLQGEAWSAVQERALVQALKTFPKETNQRWERVAAAVPGKTVNQCKKKFTLLKESFRNKKSTG